MRGLDFLDALRSDASGTLNLPARGASWRGVFSGTTRTEGAAVFLAAGNGNGSLEVFVSL
jgi:hypothetical protein